MLGIIAIFILIHTIYSSLRWRMFLQGNNEEIATLPSDIYLEIVFGAFMAIIAILSHTMKLKKINEFTKTVKQSLRYEDMINHLKGKTSKYTIAKEQRSQERQQKRNWVFKIEKLTERA